MLEKQGIYTQIQFMKQQIKIKKYVQSSNMRINLLIFYIVHYHKVQEDLLCQYRKKVGIKHFDLKLENLIFHQQQNKNILIIKKIYMKIYRISNFLFKGGQNIQLFQEIQYLHQGQCVQQVISFLETCNYFSKSREKQLQKFRKIYLSILRKQYCINGQKVMETIFKNVQYRSK
ncbi:unnamed protein product [Paramecium octaurelia]|uniref:Uncharacterized protein n=1 Tax=Paramecium octaurelia TaxID=43137 RepID=A0A8S1UIJ7_PAROT|nr:unnamed protein product [Paramecium octaurelia]